MQGTEKLVIVGGVAGVGINVTLVEARSQVLGAIDADMAYWAQHQLTDRDVEVAGFPLVSARVL